jgi:hypothetical protein
MLYCKDATFKGMYAAGYGRCRVKPTTSALRMSGFEQPLELVPSVADDVGIRSTRRLGGSLCGFAAIARRPPIISTSIGLAGR